MAEEFRVRLHPEEIARLGDSAAAADATLEVARWVARDAQAAAPRDSGEGAASIQPWPGRDTEGPYADVSWDRDHFYMGFHEHGTAHHRAQHFLRNAVDALGPYVHL